MATMMSDILSRGIVGEAPEKRKQQQPTTKVVISSFSLKHGIFAIMLLWCMLAPARNLVPIQASTQSGFDMDTSVFAIIAPSMTEAPKPFQKTIPTSCSFRQYGQRRLYGMASPEYPIPPLKESEYIHGEPPIFLATSSPNKVCTTQISVVANEYPTDGTNPSILSLQHLSNNAIYDIWKQHYPTAKYLVSLTFKANHQCKYSYNITSKEQNWKIQKDEPLPGRKGAKEADVMLLDENFQTLATTTVAEIEDPSLPPPSAEARSMDDARLLLHDNQIWLSYKRYGPHQARIMFMSQLEMSIDQDTKEWNAIATNQIEVSYGRNLGALQQQQSTTAEELNASTAALSLLAWPDPMWIQTLHIPKSMDEQQSGNKSTTEEPPEPKKFKLKKPNNTTGKSSFHGTSNMLIYLPHFDEYLGIGHFHRKLRHRRMYAAYGHHYTHAFFTFGKVNNDDQANNAASNATTNNAITSEEQQVNSNTTDDHQVNIVTSPKFELRKISQEFVWSSQVAGHENDADIIQFASGLEVVYADNTGNATPRSPSELIIGYGINDCEGAISVIKWSTVDEMLRPVSPGTEVRHTLKQVPAWIDESETVA